MGYQLFTIYVLDKDEEVVLPADLLIIQSLFVDNTKIDGINKMR